jgi:hypothetical protein
MDLRAAAVCIGAGASCVLCHWTVAKWLACQGAVNGSPRMAGAVRNPDNPIIPPSEMEHRFVVTADSLQGPFDVIVVGAGASGCSFVGRLCDEDFPDPLSVLLIEAGPEAQNSPSVTVPNRMGSLWRSEVDWGHRSTPQDGLLPRGRRMEMEQGKVLGGSSALNCERAFPTVHTVRIYMCA